MKCGMVMAEYWLGMVGFIYGFSGYLVNAMVMAQYNFLYIER